MSDENNQNIDTELEAETPRQTEKEKWVFKPRQSPKWGTVTRDGLVVGRGDTKKVVPPDEVFFLSTLGCTMREIAQWFGVPEETMKYNFYDYWIKGQEQTKQRLRSAQIKLALTGNATMLIWLGKNMLGQSDQPVNTESDQVLPWQDD